jgi:diguanylate cyclase (GGDEF)-like protein
MRRMVERIGRSIPGGRTCVLYDHDGTWTLLTSTGARIDAPAIDVDALRVDASGRQKQSASTPQVTELLGPVPSWLAVPLTTRGDRTGVVLCGSSEDHLADAHLELVGAITEQGATAYDNARLFSEVQRLATTDGLTGIANRRHFTELATRQIAVAVRYARPLAAVMLDIDHFKKINDAYGHSTGDEVIKAVATVLKEGVRESDIVGRLGGEEFALILPETHGEPVEITDRLRRAVAAATVTGPQTEVTVTISAGVAEMNADDTLDSLLSRADAALYLAKAAGRNQVCVG